MTKDWSLRNWTASTIIELKSLVPNQDLWKYFNWCMYYNVLTEVYEVKLFSFILPVKTLFPLLNVFPQCRKFIDINCPRSTENATGTNNRQTLNNRTEIWKTTTNYHLVNKRNISKIITDIWNSTITQTDIFTTLTARSFGINPE